MLLNSDYGEKTTHTLESQSLAKAASPLPFKFNPLLTLILHFCPPHSDAKPRKIIGGEIRKCPIFQCINLEGMQYLNELKKKK